MKTKNLFTKREPGQTLVIFVVALIVLLAVAMLVLDGGMFLLNRRAAQAAADAGALAGANVLCGGGSFAAAQTTANDYAVNRNTATSTSVNPTADGEGIEVKATISQSPFFMQVFGINQLNVSAVAESKCCAPSVMKNILPIAWPCTTPTTSGPVSDSPDCTAFQLDWPTQLKPLWNGSQPTVPIYNLATPPTVIDTSTFNWSRDILPQLYIFMDSSSTIDDVSVNCIISGGTMDCDLNGDGKNDIIGNGDRSWLDLDGSGGGASSLSNWIQYGYNNPLAVHTWLEGKTGAMTSVFDSVHDYMRGKVVAVPVFNQFCIGDPTGAACQTAAHATFPLTSGSDIVVWTSSSSATYFHVVGFASFFVTCVDAGSHKNCPGHDEAVKQKVFKASTKTIEGYFVKNPPFSGGSGSCTGVDMGLYMRSLTK